MSLRVTSDVGAVRQAAAEASDTLIVYFAGHGLVDAQDQLVLALPHTEFGRIETGLPYDWVRQVLLLDSRAERHVVILDCCYSGLALGRMSAGTGLADQAAVEGSFRGRRRDPYGLGAGGGDLHGLHRGSAGGPAAGHTRRSRAG